MTINPLAPTLGGILKIGDTPRTPAREDPLHTLTDIVIPAKAGIQAVGWAVPTAPEYAAGYTSLNPPYSLLSF